MTILADWYGKGPMHTAKGEIAFVNDVIRVALMRSTYVYDKDNHESYADVVANEVRTQTGNGYTARGYILGSKTVVYDSATDRSRYFAANPVWHPSPGLFLTANSAVFYKDTGVNTTSWLLGCMRFGADVTVSSAALTINIDPTDGIFYISVP